ncbi:MAG: helix-turn-helix domain-containing protein [Candidatus Eisenbacteria bacterium]|nr:helix-turn-helix domain-containing protein [Candidatus Eisenbacteria bacterium]
MAKEILDVAAAAKYLRITRATLYKLAKEKKVPGLKIGGQWRFSKDRLDELFQEGFRTERQRNPEPEPQKTKV